MKLVLVLVLVFLAKCQGRIAKNCGPEYENCELNEIENEVEMEPEGKKSWSYIGPTGTSFWSSLFKGCAGLRQSPIDIENFEEIYHKRPLKFKRYYQVISGKFFNNGHSLEFGPSHPAKQTLTGGPLKTENYQFLQLHLHWGSNNQQGSEHTLNGEKFPLEMHLVHVNKKYADDIGKALKSEDGLAVVGFFFQVDDVPNQIFEPIANSALRIGQNSKLKVAKTLVLQDFLDEIEDSAYFYYKGSLTTPECNEVVSWIVMEEPIFISSTQLATLRSLTEKDGSPMVDNFRPVQPLNGRVIKKYFGGF